MLGPYIFPRARHKTHSMLSGLSESLQFSIVPSCCVHTAKTCNIRKLGMDLRTRLPNALVAVVNTQWLQTRSTALLGLKSATETSNNHYYVGSLQSFDISMQALANAWLQQLLLKTKLIYILNGQASCICYELEIYCTAICSDPQNFSTSWLYSVTVAITLQIINSNAVDNEHYIVYTLHFPTTRQL